MILDTLRKGAVKRVEEAIKSVSLNELKERAEKISPDTGFPFEKAISKNEISFICEVKKASPSKGIIAENFPYLDIAKEYEKAGADAISVLTEPEYFLGSDKYLREIAENVSTPVLRKDFTVSDYQIYEAKVFGASAVLLICAILSDKELEEYKKTADKLGLSAIVEAHDEEEIKRAEAIGTRIIGVNNRNLKDFSVNTDNAVKLRENVSRETLFISESGIKTLGDVKRLSDIGVDAVLIGETLMRAEDKEAKLRELRNFR